MFKAIFGFFKKVIFGILLLYSFNLVASPMGVVIPINFFTISILTVLGVPALFSFILIFVLLF